MHIEPDALAIQSPPATDAGASELVELIRAEIATTGPITFARFMERALYEPGLGYYATTGQRPTREGDFVTAPELHPIFGWTVARQIEEMWDRLDRPSEFVVREYGAGRGTLATSIAQGLLRRHSPLAEALRYEQIDVHGGLPGLHASTPMIGCVLGNEFLDALPVHRIVGTDDGLREIYVDWHDERFVGVAGPPSDPRVVARAERGPALAAGQQAEISLRIPEWLTDVAASLVRGYVLLFDYGLGTAELRSSERPTGTIRAFRGQHVSSDVLAGVGHQDLTAHVDLDALEADARAAGLAPLGRTTQAQFLMGAGLEEVYAAAREEGDTDWQAALALRGAMRRLLDSRHLGSYAVIALGKGASSEIPLSGFSFALPRRV
jgi:SAM-dependent MidA family methyltransferase